MNLRNELPEVQIAFRLDQLEKEHGKKDVRQAVRLVVNHIPVEGLLIMHVRNIVLSNSVYVLSKVFEERGYL
jgi:hypothetical protein